MKNRKLLVLAFLLLGLASAQAATFSISSTYQPAPAAPGNKITIWSTITNKENATAQNVEVTLQLKYPFATTETGLSHAFFDQILPFQSKLAKLEIQADKAALNGNYTVTVQVSEDGISRIGRDLNISVIAFKPQVELIESSATITQPGSILTTTLTLRNIGSSTAKNILVGTSEDRTVTTTGVVVDRPIKTVGAAFSFLESLEPNESKTIELQLGIDSTAEQKTHLVPLTIKYQDTNRAEFSITRYLGIRVQAQAELDGTIVPDTKTSYPGGTTSFTINIFNRGSATARNVVVSLQTPDAVKITTEKKIFIGTLDPDDFDSFNVTAIIASDVQPGTLPLTLGFEYKNQDYSSESSQQEVLLPIVSVAEAQKQNGGDPIGLIILLIIIVVIGYLGYRKFRKKKK